jgi:hypothetical protein
MLHDDEGNAVMGVVQEIQGMIIRVRPELMSWSSSEISIDSRFTGHVKFRLTTEWPTHGRQPRKVSGLQVA